jgi:hypothetical protein
MVIYFLWKLTKGFRFQEETMSNQTSNTQAFEMNETAPYSSRFACIAGGSVKSFSRLEGETIHCTSGHLWVTVEDEGTDHILIAGESMAVPNSGKVLVSGPGCYQIASGADSMNIPLAS